MSFDIQKTSPDDGHEAIRLAVVQAVSDLGDASVGVDDAYMFADLLFSMVDGLYSTISDLTDRVAALEAAATPPEAT